MPLSQLRHPGLVSRLRNLERIREISQVAIKHGFGYFFERHQLLAVLRLRRRRRTPVPAQRGKHIREMLEELGPTFVKFGQVLSTRPDIVPADVTNELVLLQDRVAPMDFSVVQSVIEEDLGAPLSEVFAHFEAEAIASASIGQVHGAVLPDGQAVVVKAQRPEAANVIRKDIDLMLQIAEWMGEKLDLGFSPVAVVQEFARSIDRELDYLLEARSAMRFAANFSESENVVVPRVYELYTSKRVLTMERIDGPTLNSPTVASLPPEERRELADAVTTCWFQQILHDGFIHADPHPANLVHLGGRRFALLDFGMTGALRVEDLEEGARLFQRVVAADIKGIKRSLRRLGVQWNPSVDDAVTEAIEEAFDRYFGAALSEVDVRSLLHLLFDLVYALRIRLPSRFLMLDKAVLTLEGTIGQLSPELNIFKTARSYVDDLRRSLRDPRRVSARLRRTTAEYAQVLSDYPLLLHDLMEEMRAGELEIKYRHTGLESVIHRLDLVMNRLVVALVSIALGVSGTAVAILVEGGPHWAGLSVWGLPGFVGSLFFGAWLIYAILRSGRL